MSTPSSCCRKAFYRNTTDVNPFFANYTAVQPDGSTTHPLAGCQDLTQNPYLPFQRLDPDCVAYPSICNNCHCGPWEGDPTQSFRFYSQLFGVTFAAAPDVCTDCVRATYPAHGKLVGDSFTISNQTGNNAMLNGTWAIYSVDSANTFVFNITSAAGGTYTPATLDFRTTVNNCARDYGYRGAIARRNWNGRYGFTDDYVADPKIDTRWTAYSVSVSFQENRNLTVVYGDGSPPDISTLEGTASLTCSRHLSVGGVEICGGGTNSNQSPGVPSPGGDYYDQYFVIDSFLASATPKLSDHSQIDCDRSIITIPVPRLGTYTGPISGFQSFLDAGNLDINLDACEYGGVTKGYVKGVYTYQLTQLTNTGIQGTVTWTYNHNASYYSDAGGCVPGDFLGGLDNTHTWVFNFSASLSNPVLFSAVEGDALSLLGPWNMADDSIWDNGWMTGDCRILPMVTRRELANTKPGVGYCAPPTAPDAVDQLNKQLAAYDGSIKGQPVSALGFPNAFYNPGWFDFDAVIYHYQEPVGGDLFASLCYKYGSYAVGGDTNGLVSQATQFPDGAQDTCYLGAGWQPFTRFKVNYVLAQLPPFVTGGGGFIAGTNGDRVYAAKFAEVKKPLPSQNFFAPTDVQPNQAALDNENGWAMTPVRDLEILAGDCSPTGSYRYPDAVPIAGRAAVTFHDNGDVTFNALGLAPQLRVDDAVDFIDASSHVIAANLAVTATVTGGFKFTGSVPAGAKFMVSTGHAGDWQWFNLTPHGDYVMNFLSIGLAMTQNPDGSWAQNYTDTNSAMQRNVRPIGTSKAVICICPPGSPELSDPRWTGAHPTATVDFFTDYPSVAPMESWRANIQQGMVDRIWIDSQDNQQHDVESGSCVSLGYTVPVVEARLTAPIGAPLQFASASANRWSAMPAQDSFGIGCTGVWNYPVKKLPFAAPLDPVQTPDTQGAGDSGGAGGGDGGGL